MSLLQKREKRKRDQRRHWTSVPTELPREAIRGAVRDDRSCDVNDRSWDFEIGQCFQVLSSLLLRLGFSSWASISVFAWIFDLEHWGFGLGLKSESQQHVFVSFRLVLRIRWLALELASLVRVHEFTPSSLRVWKKRVYIRVNPWTLSWLADLYGCTSQPASLITMGTCIELYFSSEECVYIKESCCSPNCIQFEFVLCGLHP